MSWRKPSTFCVSLFALAIAAVCCVPCVYAAERTRFTPLDINAQGKALFAVSASNVPSGAGNSRVVSGAVASYRAGDLSGGVSGAGALFMSDVSKLSQEGEYDAHLMPLTCYPLGIEPLSDGRIQVLHRYGVAVYDTNTSILRLDKIADITGESAHTLDSAASPDGKWVCYIQREAHGRLCLRSTITDKEYDIGSSPTPSITSLPLKWSPDSTFFVYSSCGKIYFCDPEAIAMGVQIDSHYRYICKGTMNSVCYVQSSSLSKPQSSGLFYVEGNTINVIEQNSLYAQSIYSDILGHGRPCGILPYLFDPIHDKFSVSPDGKAVAVLKGNSLFCIYEIAPSGSPLLQTAVSISLDEARNIVDSAIMWGGKSALLWTVSCSWDGREKAVVYRTALDGKKAIVMAQEGSFHSPIVSPNGKRAAIFDGNAIRVYNNSTWGEEGTYAAKQITSAAWDGNYAMYIGTQSTVSRWIVGDNYTEALFPTYALNAAWQGDSVIASCLNGASFIGTLMPNGVYWQRYEPRKITSSSQNGQYRLFCTPSPNARFENALYVRDIKGTPQVSDGAKRPRARVPVTRPLCKASAEKQCEGRKIALIVDAYESASYLAQVLHTLKANDVKASFFVNGAFVTRYKDETRAIANSGMSVSSLFFTDIDLADGNIKADDDFIARGLERNAQEFLHVTGKEILPLWHAPRYEANDRLRRAGSFAGYKYIDAVDALSIAGNFIESTGDNVAKMLSMLETSGKNALSIPLGYDICLDMEYIIASLLDAGYEIVGAEEL